MTTVRSRSTRLSVLAAAGLLLLSAVAGCSGSGSAAQLDPNSPVNITTHNTVVSLHNRAGMPLNSVKLTVTAYGNVDFSKTLYRLENTETKDVALNELSSQDGTVFNPRLSRPKMIKVKATDTVGKEYDVEMAWR
jgi:hypothetical protein